MKTARKKLIALLCLIGVPVVIIAVWAFSGDNRPNWKYETYEEKRVDALNQVRSALVPSSYALINLPAEMASGEWSSTPNVMNCNNPDVTHCVEVDFEIPSNQVECKWIVSYDLMTADFLGFRPLNEAAQNLFTERIEPTDGYSPKNYAGKIFFEANDGSTTSDAIAFIKSDYVPKDPNEYSGSQTSWVAEKKNTLNNDDDVILVRFTNSKADDPCEWTVEIPSGIHDIESTSYKLIRSNSAATERFTQRNLN